LALKFIGARTARKQQNDVGALEGFHKKMENAIALSKKNTLYLPYLLEVHFS
jgi:hypothetical protein